MSPAGILKTRLRCMEQCDEEVTQLAQGQVGQRNVTLIDQVHECLSLCDSLRSAMTKAIKAERLSEMGNRLVLPLLLTLQTVSMADCLIASVASGKPTAAQLLQPDHQVLLPNLVELLLFHELERLPEDVQFEQRQLFRPQWASAS